MRIRLAYSGSRDGSAAIQWRCERHAAEIVAVTLDLGQGRELEAVRDRALTIGAQRAHVLDARDVQVVQDARWFSPRREGLDAYFSFVQSRVNGRLRLRMFRGEHSTISTELSEPLAHQALAPVVPSSAQH